jgi:hypothetical protein
MLVLPPLTGFVEGQISDAIRMSLNPLTLSLPLGGSAYINFCVGCDVHHSLLQDL